MLKIFISCQKYFGDIVLSELIRNKGVSVVGVSCPLDDKRVAKTAYLHNIPIIEAGTLNYNTMPPGVDLGIAAHSFDYVGKRTRYKTKFGWIGYHPSLLPRHRGRSAIEWAIKMKDFATGGTVFWLNAGIDRGDILKQRFIFIDPKLYGLDSKVAARKLWQNELQDIGVDLINQAVEEIQKGVFNKTPQDSRFSTFEPSTDVKDIFKPDLLMLEENNKI